MIKILFFTVSMLMLTYTNCRPLIFPFGDPFWPFDGFRPERLFDGSELLDRFNKSGCLREEIGGSCPFNITYVVYHHGFNNCEYFKQGGCINNTRRTYIARVCHGKCVLPPSHETATTNSGSSAPIPTTMASNTDTDTGTMTSNSVTMASNTDTDTVTSNSVTMAPNTDTVTSNSVAMTSNPATETANPEASSVNISTESSSSALPTGQTSQTS